MRQGLDTLTWEDIRLVGAIAESGSLPAAADRIGSHHSTVFRRLRQIEDRIGFPLFERDPAGLVPTPGGEDVAALAERMGAEVGKTAMRLMGREGQPSGEVRVATADSLLAHLLAPIFARFQSAFSQVQLDVVISNQTLNLSRRDADVAIRATDAPPETLIGRRAARIAWALYGHRDSFPEMGGDLGDRDWVALGDSLSTMKVVRHALQTAAPGHLRARVDSVLGLSALIASGAGIGHLPCFIGDRSPGLIRLSPPEPDFATDLWLLTHADLRRAARVRVFLDFVAEAIAGERDLIEGREPIGAATDRVHDQA